MVLIMIDFLQQAVPLILFLSQEVSFSVWGALSQKQSVGHM